MGCSGGGSGCDQQNGEGEVEEGVGHGGHMTGVGGKGVPDYGFEVAQIGDLTVLSFNHKAAGAEA